MTGKIGRSGRKPKSGTYYRLYGVRFDPSIHPPEFEQFLQALSEANHYQRAALLLDIFQNGKREEVVASVGEESLEETLALEDLFGDF